MPSLLKRTNRRELSLTRSFVNAVKSKFSSTLREKSSQYENTSRSRSRLGSYATLPPRACEPHRIRRPLPTFHPTHFIHRLPVEILAHIFVLCSEIDTMLPVSISHVCGVWRKIALRTPCLWRRICLSPGEDMWRERIYRAKACSLDVRLLPWMQAGSGNARRQILDIHAVQWCMYLVTPHIHRWRSLEIMFTEYSPFLWNAALSGCCATSKRVHAPLLEELSLVYRANDDTKEFCLFSGFASRLRRLTLDGLRLTWLPSLFRNLTYLDYTHHGFTGNREAVHEVISMLEISTCLVELRILFPRKCHISPRLPAFAPIKRRRVLLPTLRRLHLRVNGGDIPFELWQLMVLISTPSLTSLRLVDLNNGHYPFPNLGSFLNIYAMPSSVRMLRIENGWFDPQMLTPLLRMLPNLWQLAIKRPHLPDQVIDLYSRVWDARNLNHQVPMDGYGFITRPDANKTRRRH